LLKSLFTYSGIKFDQERKISGLIRDDETYIALDQKTERGKFSPMKENYLGILFSDPYEKKPLQSIRNLWEFNNC
jgi:hypothetical protein